MRNGKLLKTDANSEETSISVHTWISPCVMNYISDFLRLSVYLRAAQSSLKWSFSMQKFWIEKSKFLCLLLCIF